MNGEIITLLMNALLTIWLAPVAVLFAVITAKRLIFF